MPRIAVTVAAVCAVVVMAMAPAQAQLPVLTGLPVPGAGMLAAPTVSYIWYEPARSEVESGRGIEVAVQFSLAGPLTGRLQYAWPQSGDYSNLGLAAMLKVPASSFYVGAGYERSRGRETYPLPRDISDTQPYAFVGMRSTGTLYSIVLEAERSFGDDLKGTTLKAGVSFSF